MPGPKFDYTKLTPNYKNSEFLCEKGKDAYLDKLDKDRQKVTDVNQQVEQFSQYYCTSNTNVPAEILNTGNVKVLNNYLTKHDKELTPKEKDHLNDRIVVMKYLDSLEKHFQVTPRISSGPMAKNNDGQYVLPGVQLDRCQDTTLGCWSCAFSLLLKGRGVELDQRLIRRYRPEFVEGHELNAAWQTDMVNGNVISEIYQYSSLVNKVCPNTKMAKMNLGGEMGATLTEFKEQVLLALREKKSPVAFCNGIHWTTIVGVSEDGNTFYVADSLNRDQSKLTPVNADNYLNTSKAEIVWLEDIVLDKNGLSQQLPGNRFTVDKDTGTIRPIKNLPDIAYTGTTDLSTCGIHMTDGYSKTEYFVPDMIRDYSQPYAEQKKKSDAFAEKDGREKIEPKQPVYTMLSTYSRQNAEATLKKWVESKIFSDRKVYMKERGYFSQADLDMLSPDQADILYDRIRNFETGSNKMDSTKFKKDLRATFEVYFNQYLVNTANKAESNQASNQQQPNQPQPNQPQPNQAQSNQSQPNQAQPNQAQPNQSQPDQAQPNQAQPNQDQSNQSQPNQAQSNQSQPDQSQPNQPQPNQPQPNQPQSNQSQPDQSQPNQAQSNQSQPSNASTSDPNQKLANEEGFTLFDDDGEQKTENKSKSINPTESFFTQPQQTESELNLSPLSTSQNTQQPTPSKHSTGLGHSTSTTPTPAPDPPVNRVHRNSVQFVPTPEEFAELGKALKDAKTAVNSKLYLLLTNTMQTLGDPKKYASFTEEQRVQLMLVAASTVDEYISHKARDGVKPNVFRKLEAVERVSQYLNSALKPHQDKTYNINTTQAAVKSAPAAAKSAPVSVNTTPVSVNTTPVSVNSTPAAAKSAPVAVKSIPVAVKSIPLTMQARSALVSPAVRDYYEGLIKQNPSHLNKIANPQQRKTAGNVNTCMNKILLSAVAQKSSKVTELINMRATFANPQFVAAQFPEKKKAPVSKNTGGLRK